MGQEDIVSVLPRNVQAVFQQGRIDLHKIQEIRLRIGQAIQIRYNGKYAFLSPMGEPKMISTGCLILRKEDMKEAVDYISKYSLYAFQQDLKHGFLTLPGGHRVGVAGKILRKEGQIVGMQYISSINIRISHEQKGCGRKIVPYLFEREEFLNTLIISPPACGKTTLLRDIVRRLSNHGYQISVIDERSEIGAAYEGVPQNDLGERTDLIDACPKREGIEMAVRSMAPDIIAVDEIGGEGDMEAIAYGQTSGCKLIATIHASSMQDLKQKMWFQTLLQQQYFKRFLLLKMVGNLEGIYNEKEERICGSLQLSC